MLNVRVWQVNRVTTQIVVESDREDKNPDTTFLRFSVAEMSDSWRVYVLLTTLRLWRLTSWQWDPGADLPSAMVLSDIQVLVWSQCCRQMLVDSAYSTSSLWHVLNVSMKTTHRKTSSRHAFLIESNRTTMKLKCFTRTRRHNTSQPSPFQTRSVQKHVSTLWRVYFVMILVLAHAINSVHETTSYPIFFCVQRQNPRTTSSITLWSRLLDFKLFSCAFPFHTIWYVPATFFAKAEWLAYTNDGKQCSSKLKHRSARHRTEETCVRAVCCPADLSRSPVIPTRLLAAVFSKLCWARSYTEFDAFVLLVEMRAHTAFDDPLTYWKDSSCSCHSCGCHQLVEDEDGVCDPWIFQ